MPTQRDEAAEYRERYEDMRRILPDFDHDVIARRISLALEVGPLTPWSEGNLDAATDILMERGLCSSVLNWHTRPARADDLEW